MSERTRDRILFQLKTRGGRSAAQIAGHLQLSTVAVRQNLAALEAEGLVDPQSENTGRVGRPTTIWKLTDHGHRLFPDNHADLTLEILDAVRAAFGKSAIDRVVAARSEVQGERYRQALESAKTTKERVAALARLRRQEGYMAQWRSKGDGFVLVENHCPICAAARTCQGLCAEELELFRKVLGKDVHVERTEHLFDGARRCAYSIEPKRTNSQTRRHVDSDHRSR